MIGSKLNELRNKHRYTISQLCDLLDINPNTYAKYERDERDVSTETLSKLADFYNVSTDYLLGRDNGDQTALDELAGRFNMSLLEKKIVENYLNLDEKMRGDLMEFLAKTVKEVEAESAAADITQEKSETQPDEDEGELTMVAARSFGKDKNNPPEPIRLKKRKNAGSILDLPDYKGD